MSRSLFATTPQLRTFPTKIPEIRQTLRHVDALVVDDNETAVHFLTELLELEGLSFASALSGKDALDMLLYIRPRILLLDIRMPGMSGIDVLHHMRGSVHLADVPVVFVSAEDPALITDPLVSTIPYVRKPVHVCELLTQVHENIAPNVFPSLCAFG